MVKSTLTGGDGIKKHLEELSKQIGGGGVLRVGFLENSAYPDGTPVPLVAAANEFGDPGHNRPPRPFFRIMLAEKAPGWGVKFGKILKATDYDLGRSLGLMGEMMKGELQQSIRDFVAPELAESTIAAKGFDKPLIDTGHMLNSVDYDIKGDQQ
jgi:hypothetical protein